MAYYSVFPLVAQVNFGCLTRFFVLEFVFNGMHSFAHRCESGRLSPDFGRPRATSRMFGKEFSIGAGNEHGSSGSRFMLSKNRGLLHFLRSTWRSGCTSMISLVLGSSASNAYEGSHQRILCLPQGVYSLFK